MKNSKKLTSLALSSALLVSPLVSNQAFAAGTSFTDISNSYAKDAILELANAGILNGIGGGQFNPNGSITRQDFAIILAKALKLDVSEAPATATFKDVPTTSRAFAYVEAVAEAGLIKGYSNGNFKGTENLSREQMAVLFVRALGVDAAGYGAKLTFSDAASIGSYAKDAVGYAVEQGLLQGTKENTFNPKGQAEREAVAKVASKFLKVKKELDEKEPEPTPIPEPTPEPVPIPTPVPEPAPAPSPGSSLRTPPDVTSTVTRDETSFSFTPGTAWTNKITSISVKFNDEESREFPLELVNLQEGYAAFEPISPGDTVVVTIKATGYKNKVITLQGPPFSSEVGINIEGFSSQTIEDQTVLVGESEGEVTVGSLKNGISSTDKSEQTYEVFGESLTTPLSDDEVLAFGTVYIVNVTSEDEQHSEDYKVIVNRANRAPIVANTIEDKNGIVGSEVTVNLTNVFTDADDDNLSITSDKGTTNETGTTWSYTPVEGDLGSIITVTVSANDGKGGMVSDTFNIVVVTNQSPIVTTPYPDISFSSPSTQMLSDFRFSDPDNDTLSFTFTSSDNSIATVSASEFGMLKITKVGTGIVTITVTANDGKGGTVSDSFQATVQ